MIPVKRTNKHTTIAAREESQRTGSKVNVRWSSRFFFCVYYTYIMYFLGRVEVIDPEAGVPVETSTRMTTKNIKKRGTGVGSFSAAGACRCFGCWGGRHFESDSRGLIYGTRSEARLDNRSKSTRAIDFKQLKANLYTYIKIDYINSVRKREKL